MSKLIVIATIEEKKLIDENLKGEKVLLTGVGGLNVIEKLKDVPKNTEIINIGYAGSNCLNIGTRVEVSQSSLYHKVEYSEPVYNLDGTVPCFTSNDFVTSTDIKEPCVFDMELAYILALGFKNVKSIKIVSDNLSLKQYEQTVSE